MQTKTAITLALALAGAVALSGCKLTAEQFAESVKVPCARYSTDELACVANLIQHRDALPVTPAAVICEHIILARETMQCLLFVAGERAREAEQLENERNARMAAAAMLQSVANTAQRNAEMYQRQQANRISCTTNRVGDYTYTNCN